MAIPVSIEVSVDSTEYSRYEEDKATISVSVILDGGAPYTDEDVLVELIKARRSRDTAVASVTLTANTSTDPTELTTTFYLPEVIDPDEFSLVRFGKYFVRATSVTDSSIYGDSEDFDISVISVDRFKRDYLFGLDLKATEILKPKFQPISITGVTVTEVSKGHSTGFGTLTYNYSVDPVSNAGTTVGSGADGTVDIDVSSSSSYLGSLGNSLLVEVVVPSGTSPLSATFASNTLTISLDVTAGVPNAGANTATLVAAAVSALSDFDAVASGTGADPLTVAESLKQFTGGVSNKIRLLSWKGGQVANITKAGSYILKSGSKFSSILPSIVEEYIVVKIPALSGLQTQTLAEEILIDKEVIDDRALREYLLDAIAWVENDYLCTYIEPTNITTDRDPTTIQFSVGINSSTPLFSDTDFDFVVSPLTYFRPQHGQGWVHINTPYSSILRVDSLFGAVANTRVIDIDLEWIQPAMSNGIVQLVPFSQEVAFDFIGLIWTQALRGLSELPNFWHFNMICGLKDCPPEVQELIGKKAAIRALTVLGLALRPGVGSLSLSRDGVSQSVSYLSSAQFGMFTATINAYNKWFDDHGKQLRARYRGPWLAVV